MKAAVFADPAGPLVVEKLQLLPPSPGRFIVRTGATPFCATDVMNARGLFGKVPPTILGHASTGVVEELGPGVTGLRIGDRVVVHGTAECGRCFYCGIGRPDQCDEIFGRPDGPPVVAARSDGEPVTAAGNVGGYAEFMCVSAAQVLPVATDLPDEHLALLGCGVTTGLGAVFNVARVVPGTAVAVVGCGQLGLWMVQAARLAGAERIIAVEPLAARRETAARLGATDLVDPGEADPVEQVRALTFGRGADYALEAAGPAAAQTQALLMTRRAGTVVLTGVAPLGTVVTVPQIEYAIHGRTVLGCQNGRVRMRRDIPAYVRMLEDDRLDAGPLITARYALEDINEALTASADHNDLSGLVIPAL
ncbi:zinc-binding dehydrogenase [Streptomyces sp. V4I2]|uniref:zinc-binding dehydrogenase n=1 Tax=Streptomyces sp. V4I2 TaxID=3042280 RepID=UPI0027889B45|nr:zinc-binding dehydrogenase [Streptomyces sp. V4I2]MDQ1042395.1 S-(hydroxymethyl)glutathione dehydrogenase/alcohol dehydrogenase [Streptomyces sp. V4I2]